jgi:alpha-glucosidase
LALCHHQINCPPHSAEETQQGPLTLRVYAGGDCRGSFYTDDGQSFAFKRGNFLRMNFTCALTSSGIEVNLSKHEGSFVPWWKNLRLEIYGWSPSCGVLQQDGGVSTVPMERGNNFVFVTVPDPGTGTSLKLE